MENKRTLEQTLLRCKKLWEWLKNNPGSDKDDAYANLGWTPSYDGGDESNCPCCEHVNHHHPDEEENCRLVCPLDWSHFTKYKYKIHCNHKASPFDKWDILDITDRQQRYIYADQIVQLCDAALKNIK